jgi:hypothetical protein
MTTRRSFFRWLGTGLVASTAAILNPAELLAGWRSRRNAHCTPCPPQCLPDQVGGRACDVLQHGIRKRVRAGQDVTQCYPPPGGGVIPGGGDFCCWGYVGSSNIYVQEILFTDMNGNLLPVNQQPQTVPTDISNSLGSDWGFAVSNYEPGVTFYLVYVYWKPDSTGTMTKCYTKPNAGYTT